MGIGVWLRPRGSIIFASLRDGNCPRASLFESGAFGEVSLPTKTVEVYNIRSGWHRMQNCTESLMKDLGCVGEVSLPTESFWSLDNALKKTLGAYGGDFDFSSLARIESDLKLKSASICFDVL